METTGPIGRIIAKHIVLDGAVLDPGPQKEGPLHPGLGAILETLISLPLTGQGALRLLDLPLTIAELSLLSANL